MCMNPGAQTPVFPPLVSLLALGLFRSPCDQTSSCIWRRASTGYWTCAGSRISSSWWPGCRWESGWCSMSSTPATPTTTKHSGKERTSTPSERSQHALSTFTLHFYLIQFEKTFLLWKYFVYIQFLLWMGRRWVFWLETWQLVDTKWRAQFKHRLLVVSVC